MGEPSEMEIALAERGGAWVKAVAHGKAAHGSQPDRGVNAILTMSRFLLRLPEALPDRVHPLVGPPTVNVALVTGGSAPNVVPDRCEVEIDRRIVPGEDDPEEVLAPFRALVADLVAERPETDIEISLKDWTEAAETTGDSTIAAVVRDSIAAETGSSTAVRRLHRHHGRSLLHQRRTHPDGDRGAWFPLARAHRERVHRALGDDPRGARVRADVRRLPGDALGRPWSGSTSS